METKRKSFLARAAMTLLVMMLTTMTAWADDSGDCGDNVTYSYVESTNTLTISGSGDMYDFWLDNRPWESYKNEITTVVIEDGVTSIGSNAFYYCENLENVSIGNGVTSIGDDAFDSCNGLTSIEIPDGVTTIGDWAFYNCSNLSSVTIYAPSLNHYGTYAFDCNDFGRKIYVPIASFGDYRSGWSDYESDIVGFGNCGENDPESVRFELAGTSNNCTLIISGDGEMYDFEIGNNPWESYKDEITTVVIEDDVTSIGNYAFYYCENLANVTIGNNVTSIHHDAFTGCTSLTSIEIPASVTSIGINAFPGSGLTSVEIQGYTTIGNSAFENCQNLTTVTIGDNVESIGEKAFGNCGSLASINVDTNNANYSSDDGVLFNKFKTTLIQYPNGKADDSYTIPASVTSIGNWAFAFCYLTSITISADVTSIGEWAFESTDLVNIYFLPSTAPEVGDFAFHNFDGTFYFRGDAYSWSETEEGASHITLTPTYTVTLGTGITINETPTISYDDIDYYAAGSTLTLSGCAYYKITKDEDGSVVTASVLSGSTLTMPPYDISVNEVIGGTCGSIDNESDVTWTYDEDTKNLTISGSGAMRNFETDNRPWESYKDEITTVVIEDGVTSIGNNAFKDCPSLASVTIYAPELTYYGSNAFDGNADGRKIYVFSDCVTAYKAGWSGYAADILPIEGIDLTANAHDGNYWTTFYCSDTNYKIDEGEDAWAYTAEYDAVNTQLTLHKLGKVIPKNTAVIIVGADASIDMTALCNAVAEYSVGNDLHGVDVRTEKSTLGSGTFYVLGKQNDNFGFFQYTGDYMPARKAYLLVSGSAAPGLKMVFDDETTSLTPNSPGLSQGEGSDYWYTLSGTRLNAKPTKPGLYINNGRKVVVK